MKKSSQELKDSLADALKADLPTDWSKVKEILEKDWKDIKEHSSQWWGQTKERSSCGRYNYWQYRGLR